MRRRGYSAGTTDAERARYVRTLGPLLASIDVIRREAERLDASTSTSRWVALHVHLINFSRKADGIDALLAVLREYRLSPADRKVLETVSADLQRKAVRAPSGLAGRDAYRRKVLDLAAKYEHAFSLSKSLLEGGDDACERNECLVAGCFRVVNAGGFDQATMNAASKITEEAARLVNKAGFSEVCYGDAYITQKVSREKVRAFYSTDEDRMYVRAKPGKGEEVAAVESVVHELGHRLHNKFGTPEMNRRLESVYQSYLARFARSAVDYSSFQPVVGETFEVGRRTYRIVAVGRPSTYQTVAYQRLLPDGSDDPKYMTTSMPIAKLALALNAGRRVDDPFPSPYARVNEKEFFAEMFRAYVVGQATAEQRKALESMLGR